MKIYGVELKSAMEEEMYKELLQFTASEKRKRIERFRNPADAERTLLGDILMRCALIEMTGISNDEIHFTTNSYGKPVCSDLSICFNISHSGKWVVCAMDEHAIGIDVEEIKTMDFSFAENFLSIQENHDLIMKAENEKLGYFYDLWTLKESYIKACGMGLSIPLDSFSIKLDNHRITIETDNSNDKWFFKQYPIGNNYKLAVCAQNNIFPENIKMLDVSTLYENISAKGGY